MVITSKDNDQIKRIKKLKDKKTRDEYNEYFIEGVKLIREAIVENVEIKTIVICDNCIKSGEIDQKILYEIAKYNCIYTDEKVFKSIADVQSPQGILAVVAKNNVREEDKRDQKRIDYNDDIIVVLDDIQDPGNMGSILRTVDSTGLKQVVISKSSADIYNPKVVRSTMGAIFRLNIIESDNLEETLKIFKKHKFKVAVTSLDTDKSIYQVDYKKTVIVIGNEANGVSKEVIQMADEKIKIPMIREDGKFKRFCCNWCNTI